MVYTNAKRIEKFTKDDKNVFKSLAMHHAEFLLDKNIKSCPWCGMTLEDCRRILSIVN